MPADQANGTQTMSGGGGGKLGVSEWPFKALVDHTPVSLAILDRDGAAFRFVNAATSRLLGYPADNLVGQQAVHLVHPDDNTRVTDAIVQCLQQLGQPIATECRLCHLD